MILITLEDGLDFVLKAKKWFYFHFVFHSNFPPGKDYQFEIGIGRKGGEKNEKSISSFSLLKDHLVCVLSFHIVTRQNRHNHEHMIQIGKSHGSTLVHQKQIDRTLTFFFPSSFFNYTILFLVTDIQVKIKQIKKWMAAIFISTFKCGCLPHLFRGEPSVTTTCYVVGVEPLRLDDGQNRALPKIIRHQTSDS
jgi:hypothetical protein